MAVSKVVLGDETLVDLTSDTVSEDTLLEGTTAHASNGEQITGGVVVTPMYTGTKSDIESAIAEGKIPEDSVVNITDDEETSSFQTQINEINSSLITHENYSYGSINITSQSANSIKDYIVNVPIKAHHTPDIFTLTLDSGNGIPHINKIDVTGYSATDDWTVKVTVSVYCLYDISDNALSVNVVSLYYDK